MAAQNAACSLQVLCCNYGRVWHDNSPGRATANTGTRMAAGARCRRQQWHCRPRTSCHQSSSTSRQPGGSEGAEPAPHANQPYDCRGSPSSGSATDSHKAWLAQGVQLAVTASCAGTPTSPTDTPGCQVVTPARSTCIPACPAGIPATHQQTASRAPAAQVGRSPARGAASQGTSSSSAPATSLGEAAGKSCAAGRSSCRATSVSTTAAANPGNIIRTSATCHEAFDAHSEG